MAEVIGLVGVVVGALLTEMLNYFRRRGKIKVFQNTVDISFSKRDNYGGFTELLVTPGVIISSAEIDSMVLNLNIDIFNSSPTDTKIARDIKYSIKSRDYAHSGRLLDTTNTDPKKFGFPEHVNIKLLPNEIYNITSYISFNTKIKQALEADWYIEFKNNKNELVSIKLEKPDISHIRID